MKTLSDIDHLYKETISNLSLTVRFCYCTRSLDKLQIILVKNTTLMDPQLKENLKEMIKATQQEISGLEKLK